MTRGHALADQGDGATVLVTGASGFIGRELVGLLVSSGYRVVAASRVVGGPADPGVRTVGLPLAETASDQDFDRLLEGVDYVVHLAGIAHTRLPPKDAAAAYHHANMLLTERLAKAAAGTLPGKFVFVSSIRAQCGGTYAGIAVESDPPQPTDAYGRSKLAAENAVAKTLARGNFSILRPVLVYGAGVRGNMGALIALAKLPLPLPFGSLTAKRSLLSRTALCRAILHCMRQPATDGGTFIVADRTPLTAAQIVAALRNGLGRRPAMMPFPPALLALAARLLGQSSRFETLSQDLVASSQALEATGWSAVKNPAQTLAGIFSDP
ncbi:MAG: NAD-dependent epimerase/dehydratase family protein [Allorhizobium sp.]